MNRKSLALAIVLLIAGLAPATAILGFCAHMPCCSHAAEAAAFSTDGNDCCTTIACYESPSLELTTGPASADAVLVVTAVIVMAPAPPVVPITQALADPSPPTPLRHRLAILATLLL